MKGQLIASDSGAGGRRAAALLVDGRLEDLLVDAPADAPPMPGAILAAKVTRPAKGSGGGFVDLGSARGFLRGPGGAAGRMLAAQVTGVVEPGKAVPMTAAPLYKGRFAVLTPGRPGVNVARTIQDGAERARLAAIGAAAMADRAEGLILRSAASGAEAGSICAEVAALCATADGVDAALSSAVPGAVLWPAPDAPARAARDWPEAERDQAPGAFARHGVWEAITAAQDPVHALPGGGWMAIEPTRALIAVDVNTGGDFSPAAGLKALIAVAHALPRVLRVRGLGGQIAIDPARLSKPDRKRAEEAFRRAFRADPVETTLAGWTPLGHLEINRQRDRWPSAGFGP